VPSSPEEQFQAKRGLVHLFKAQLELLRTAEPDGVSSQISLALFDELLAKGPQARWPTGVLAGLREGIRDAQHMLELAYGPSRRTALMRDLRERVGDAVQMLELRDASRLRAILKRGRVRGEAEYYLVRAAIDRLESEPHPDQGELGQLRALADQASLS